MASKRKAVEESLMEQLKAMGADKEHYVDLLRDYMGLWDIKVKLLEDVKDRGVMYQDVSSVGVPMMKNNPSTKELVMVNKQMLSILKELGLSTKEISVVDGDDEM